MNKQMMFNEIKELCKACGMGIDKIARDCNINQNLVAKTFMETMNLILNKMDKRGDTE